jgi:hypothetical protein
MSALNTYEFAFYELAYSYWQEPSYLKIITRARPLNDIYILGPVSLTHANRFELEEISPVLPEDLNNDGIVNMRDIAIVAGLFGTRKGDNNWNSIADLDGNGIVNMRDVSRVAKSYGKTTS